MNYIQILEELKKYYANLLIVQYHNKPKAKTTIKLLVDLCYSNMLMLQIRDGFDWKNALLAQLEIIGQWVGVDKFYKGQLFDFHPWFSLIDWNSAPDNLQGGFSTFENFEALEGGFLDYENINPTQNILPQEVFRTLMGLKIIKNNIDHKCKTIDEAIWKYFNGKVYTVWNLKERVLIYYYPSELNVLMKTALQKSALPYPPAVNIQLKEIIDDNAA